MRFITFVFKSLARRRFRSVVTIVGVAMAVGAVVALVGISHDFTDSFSHLYDARGVDLVIVRAGVTERLTSTLDEKLGDSIRKLPEVREVAPVLLDVVSFEELNLFGVPILGWPPGSFLFGDLKIISGRPLKPGDTKMVILGTVLAKNLEKEAGDLLEVMEDEPFQVVGIYQSSSVHENGSMIVPIADLQRLMDRGGRVNVFDVIAKNPADQDAIDHLKAEIEKLAPGLAAMTTQTFVQSNTQIRIARAMAWLTSIIALVIGSVGMLNTMIMSVFERTQEIGILRAIGWRKSRVMRMILLEATVLSACGAVLGIAAAAALVRLLSTFPSASGFITGEIAPTVIAQAAGLALLLGFIGGVYPALHGANLLPTEALRHE